MRHSRTAILIISLALTGGCASERGTHGGNADDQGLFFPVHDSADAPDALGLGALREVDGCLVVDAGTPPALLPVWPEGFRFEDGTLFDANGDAIATLGDEVELGGGEISKSVFGELTGETIPTRCRDSVPFVVGEAKSASS